MEKTEQSTKPRRTAAPLSKPLSIRLSEKCIGKLKELVQRGPCRTYAEVIEAALSKSESDAGPSHVADKTNDIATILTSLNALSEKVDQTTILNLLNTLNDKVEKLSQRTDNHQDVGPDIIAQPNIDAERARPDQKIFE